MPEVRLITFSHREIAEELVRKEGVKDGHWGLYIEFGIGGGNVGTSREKEDVVPAAIVPVLKLGIQRFDKPNSLTVDASKVNPSKRKKTEVG